MANVIYLPITAKMVSGNKAVLEEENDTRWNSNPQEQVKKTSKKSNIKSKIIYLFFLLFLLAIL